MGCVEQKRGFVLVEFVAKLWNVSRSDEADLFDIELDGQFRCEPLEPNDDIVIVVKLMNWRHFIIFISILHYQIIHSY